MRLTVKQIEQNILLLICALPLLVPFGLMRNIGLQAMVVTLSGVLAWYVMLSNWRQWPLGRLATTLMVIYILAIVVSCLFHASAANVFGTRLIRLGCLELIAACGIGLCLQRVKTATVHLSLYASLVTLAAVSLPYTLWHYGHLARIGGLLYQPDLLAVLLAAGIVFGVAVWQDYPRYRRLTFAAQAYLTALLLLTQTRAVIMLLVVVLGLLVVTAHASWRRRLAFMAGLLGVLLLGMAVVHWTIGGGRLTNTGYAAESIVYRLHLQSAGLQRFADSPLTGYGMGELHKPLACEHMSAADLQKTCQDGYFFNSSHNIYIDRWLGLGLLGGISFVVLTIMGVVQGVRYAGQDRRTILAAFILIAFYYFTNITSLHIEVLYWVSLVILLTARRSDLTTTQRAGIT